jgi:hypothetical protein
MTLWLRDLLDRFDLLSLRERVMIMGAAVLLTVMVWDGLLMEPQAKARKARLGQVEALRAEVAGLTQGIESMAAQGVVDPDRQAREAVAALRQEIAALDARMAGADDADLQARRGTGTGRHLPGDARVPAGAGGVALAVLLGPGGVHRAGAPAGAGQADAVHAGAAGGLDRCLTARWPASANGSPDRGGPCWWCAWRR